MGLGGVAHAPRERRLADKPQRRKARGRAVVRQVPHIVAFIARVDIDHQNLIGSVANLAVLAEELDGEAQFARLDGVLEVEIGVVAEATGTILLAIQSAQLTVRTRLGILGIAPLATNREGQHRAVDRRRQVGRPGRMGLEVPRMGRSAGNRRGIVLVQQANEDVEGLPGLQRIRVVWIDDRNRLIVNRVN